MWTDEGVPRARSDGYLSYRRSDAGFVQGLIAACSPGHDEASTTTLVDGGAEWADFLPAPAPSEDVSDCAECAAAPDAAGFCFACGRLAGPPDDGAAASPSRLAPPPAKPTPSTPSFRSLSLPASLPPSLAPPIPRPGWPPAPPPPPVKHVRFSDAVEVFETWGKHEYARLEWPEGVRPPEGDLDGNGEGQDDSYSSCSSDEDDRTDTEDDDADLDGGLPEPGMLSVRIRRDSMPASFLALFGGTRGRGTIERLRGGQGVLPHEGAPVWDGEAVQS